MLLIGLPGEPTGTELLLGGSLWGDIGSALAECPVLMRRDTLPRGRSSIVVGFLVPSLINLCPLPLRRSVKTKLLLHVSDWGVSWVAWKRGSVRVQYLQSSKRRRVLFLRQGPPWEET